MRTYSFKTILGVTRNVGIDQPFVECGDAASRAYDANGNLISKTNWNGNKTTYSYDLSRNLETSRTEAVGTAQARTITTQWHPTYRLPVQITEPGRITTLAYDPSGNLLQKTITAGSNSRSWSYTYNAVGQVLTATGPRTDVADTTSYSYDPQGNLASITNAAGQVTTLSNYDTAGHVGRITDPNGVTTGLTYDPRGRLTARSIAGETTTYTYDSTGQLTNITLPDGASLNYTYDAAHRLTQVSDSLGNRITYTLDALGNRIQEQVKDPTGALTRQTSRIYDTLNRLQQVTGGLQ